MKRTLPGLADFYMAGQWVFMGGGIPGAILSGRHAMQVICKKDKKKFQASTPQADRSLPDTKRAAAREARRSQRSCATVMTTLPLARPSP
ncbi:MAG: hypothetical protein JSU73_01465 [candidate division WOR-3 bacterium]|nr:MAG: hypothetical protein JSU73_01465 [candidate division WOR-3 bacterium]